MADYIKPVSFQGAPIDDQLAIQRQQRLAQMLQQQASEPIQANQMVSGRAVPIGLAQGLSKLAQGYFAGTAADKADTMARDAVQRQRESRQSTLGQLGGVDEDTAIKIALSSEDPAIQQMGMEMYKKKLMPKEYGSQVHYDQNGKAFLTGKTGEVKYLEGVAARDKKEVTKGGEVYNPYDVQPGTTFQDPNKPFSLGPGGTPVPNAPYQQYELANSKAKAPNVSVNTAQQPFLQGLGKTASEAVQAGFDQAKAAQDVLRNVAQIKSAGDKIFSGPGANARVTLAQIGEVLGVNGKDTTEKLANTRNVIQGLARQELAAAGQMKGQGQITENERAILKKAESGDLSNMTKVDLAVLLGALEKTANYRINSHNQTLERLKQDPNAASMVPYMTLPGMNKEMQNRQVVVDF